MRDKFYGYYTPTDDEFSSMWQDSLFVFDTNTLLNLYRYTEGTYSSFVQVIKSLSERIWIPYKVADEFHKNRINCISDQQLAYTDIVKAYDKVFSEFSSKLNKYKQHKLIKIDTYKKRFKTYIDKEQKQIETIKNNHPDFINKDNVLDTITEILHGKIGEEYEKDYLKSLYEEGEKRYARKTPPGYMDSNKSDKYRLYGDLIIWKDIIAKGKASKKPIIFVTSDNKEDWWLNHNGKDLGPRPELLQEFRRESGYPIYIYSPDRFIKYASKFLNQTTQPTVLTEIENVQKTQHADHEENSARHWRDEDIKKFNKRIEYIGVDAPLSEKRNLNSLLRKQSMYTEEMSITIKRIQSLQNSIKTIDALITRGATDHDLKELEDKREAYTSRLFDHQYELHEIQERINRLRHEIRDAETKYTDFLSNRCEDVPF